MVQQLPGSEVMVKSTVDFHPSIPSPGPWSHAEIHERMPGCWYTYPSEKYEFVSWDDETPNIWKVIKFMFKTTKQILNNSF